MLMTTIEVQKKITRPGLDILFAGRAGPGLITQFAGPARAGSAQLLRARAGPGPQIIFAGRAWA